MYFTFLVCVSILVIGCFTYGSYVSVAYILQAPEGFRLNATFSNITGVVVAVVFLTAFMMRVKKENNKVEKTEKVG